MTTDGKARTCGVCKCGLVPNKSWQHATADQRAAWRRQGLARGARTNRCTSCRERELRIAKQTTVTDPTNPWTHCRRCGVPEETKDVCTDCTETVARMGETDRWVA